MKISDFRFQSLNETFDLSSFDCNDADINEFLKMDAFNYEREKMACTYLFMHESEIAAFFSISNDCIKDLGEEKGFTSTIWNRLHRKTEIPNSKRIRQYPALKIGRLGVCTKYHGTGFAYQLMDFIKGWIFVSQISGCRFLTLDAYNQEKQLKYYEKNGFRCMLDEDKTDTTRTMYFDMMRFTPDDIR